MISVTSADRLRTLCLVGTLIGLSIALSACNTTEQAMTEVVPNDYRLRHPIALQEAADRSVEIFIGRARGGLTGPQRGDVIQLAQTWTKEGTDAIVIDEPVDTTHAKAAASVVHEVRGLLEANGVPARGIRVRRYHPDDPRALATVRLSYPRIGATAGPCGMWPNDLGPSIDDPDYYQNKPYYNFGCATQRNLAAMVDNPADLAQPRGDTPIYTARRSVMLDKYRKGESTATVYPNENKGKISDVGN